MAITELLDELYEEIDSEGINLENFSIYDEEDLTAFALRYLMANLGNAFEQFDEEAEELVAL